MDLPYFYYLRVDLFFEIFGIGIASMISIGSNVTKSNRRVGEIIFEDNQQRTQYRGSALFIPSTIQSILRAFGHWYSMPDEDFQQGYQNLGVEAM